LFILILSFQLPRILRFVVDFVSLFFPDDLLPILCLRYCRFYPLTFFTQILFLVLIHKSNLDFHLPGPLTSTDASMRLVH